MGRWAGMRSVRQSLMLAVCALCWPMLALAHPHGSIECKAQVRLEAGRVQTLRGELLMDEQHSQQAIGLLRDASGQVDAQRLLRFVFALKMQIGRMNWLFDVKADGESVEIQPRTDPRVDIVNDRIRIVIDYLPDLSASPASRFSLNCNDPTYYYVTSFGSTITQALADSLPNTADPAQLAAKLGQIRSVGEHSGAVTVKGCPQLRIGVRDEKLGAPRPGMARLDWVCQP